MGTLKPYNPQSGSNQDSYTTDRHVTFTSHIVHWNGQSWSDISLPGHIRKESTLHDVAVIADNNIWTTSESGKAKSKQSGFDAIEHWDGSS